MKALKSWWKKIGIPALGAIAGLFILGVLGHRLYTQWKSMDELSKHIQALPTLTTSPIPTTSAQFSPVDPDKKVALEKDYIALENSITGTLVQIIGGLFFVVTAYFTWRNLRVAEDKQVTERFTQAINQIGSERIEVRSGGIYALERIAKDSPNDHWTIMETLASFVRARSLQSLEVRQLKLREVSEKEETFLSHFLPRKEQESHDAEQLQFTTDLQAALTVIGRRDTEKESEKQRIDLRQVNIGGSNLNDANFSGVFFIKADLSNTDLRNANLSRANLSRANLSMSYLRNTNFNGAKLSGTKLSGAILLASDLRSAKDLTEQQLEGDNPPLLCNVALPGEILTNPYRDCDRLPEVLHKRYPEWFVTIDEAKIFVNRERQKKWI